MPRTRGTRLLVIGVVLGILALLAGGTFTSYVYFVSILVPIALLVFSAALIGAALVIRYGQG
jgi:hypothetical protein